MWFTGNVVSSPSSVSTRSFMMSPALLTSTSTRGNVAVSRAASARTARCEPKSATKRATSPRLHCWISARARSPLSRVRQTIATWAPARARATAVSLPIPEVVPVTTQVLPFMSPPTVLRPEDRVDLGGRAIREEQVESVPERRAHDEPAGLHEEVPRRRPAAETRLERIGGLPALDPLGAA